SRVISGATVVTTVCLLPMHTGCGCSGHPAFPAPSSSEGQCLCKTSGESCRENINARLFLRCHAPRMRGIQYSRGAGAGNEKPRCTGYPACADNDGLMFCPRAEALAKASKPGDDEWRGSLKIELAM